MADDLIIEVGAELDLNKIQSQLDSIKKDNKIKILADTKEAEQKVSELKKSMSSKAPAKIVIDVLKGQSDANINGYIKGIQSKFQASPIKLTFGVDEKASQSYIKSFIDQLQKQIVNLKVNPSVPTGAGKGSGGGNGAGSSGSSLPAWNRIPGMKKVKDELDAVVNEYIKDLTKKGATKISSSVSATYSKDGTPDYKGLVSYQTAVGETVNAVMQLDKATNVWRVSSTSVAKNYAAQAKEIEKVNAQIQKEEQYTKDFMSKQQTSMNKEYAKAFQMTNPLKGQFKDEFDKVYKEWQDEYNKVGARITKDQETRLKELEAKTKLAFDVQSKAQSGATTLAKKDVTSEVEIRKNDIEAAIEKLNRLGITSGDVRDKFDALQNSVNSISDIQGLQTWNAQFKEAESALKRFEQSAEGMGQKLTNSLETGQLSQIDQIQNKLSNLDQNLSGAGVQAIQQNLAQLKTAYEEVQNQLNAPNLSDDQYRVLAERLKVLDDQLKQVANATKIFNDGIQNEQAIQAYNRDVENLSNRFERLKEKYQEFLKQNPGKASASVEASMERFANALRNVDPTNIKNLKGDFRNLNTEVNNTIAPAQTLSQILSNNFGAVGQYLGRFVSVTYLITKAVSTIKSMANEVKEVDSSLVELQKVTSLTGQELDNFVDKAYDVGKGLGRTGKDVIDATTTFSRAGYDLQQATELAQSALVMTNVGVDIPNMESAASDMISILKAYDIQAEESMAVIDKLYNVSNKEPLDFGNLTQMLVTAGGTLAQTGTTLDETMALLTASFATMRDTSVANG